MNQYQIYLPMEKPDTAAEIRVQSNRQGPLSWGVITLSIVGDFTPKNLKSRPPSVTDGLGGHEVGQMFSHAFNRSEFAKLKKRWALVCDTGTVVLIHMDADKRPASPEAFPSCVTAGLTVTEAVEFANDLNSPRLKLSRVPRQWSVPVRAITAEGGAQ